MRLIFWALLAIIVLFLFFQFVFYKKKKSINKSVTYICAECGERDCICHKLNFRVNFC